MEKPEGFEGNWTNISIADHHKCGIDSGGNLYCWGEERYGKLGHASTTEAQVHSPKAVVAPEDEAFSGKWKSVSVGQGNTCAIDTNGKAYCIGHGTFGTLGNGQDKNVNKPVPVTLPEGHSGKWLQLSVGRSHVCGIDSNQDGYCWGDNFYGNLGVGHNNRSFVPLPIKTPSGEKFQIKEISARLYYTCALRPRGKIVCFGGDFKGSLGNGDETNNQHYPKAVYANNLTFSRMMGSGKGMFLCALNTEGKPLCWGDNTYGQTGHDPNETESVIVPTSPPAFASLPKFVEIDSGFYHTCAATADDKVYCWGLNNHAQLGNQKRENSFVPVLVNMSPAQ